MTDVRTAVCKMLEAGKSKGVGKGEGYGLTIHVSYESNFFVFLFCFIPRFLRYLYEEDYKIYIPPKLYMAHHSLSSGTINTKGVSGPCPGI